MMSKSSKTLLAIAALLAVVGTAKAEINISGNPVGDSFTNDGTITGGATVDGSSQIINNASADTILLYNSGAAENAGNVETLMAFDNATVNNSGTIGQASASSGASFTNSSGGQIDSLTWASTGTFDGAEGSIGTLRIAGTTPGDGSNFGTVENLVFSSWYGNYATIDITGTYNAETGSYDFDGITAANVDLTYGTINVTLEGNPGDDTSFSLSDVFGGAAVENAADSLVNIGGDVTWSGSLASGQTGWTISGGGITAVPEPASLSILTLAAGAMLYRRSKR
ncbi:MAG: PEP-CTERM sorting domain-containing protein [Phycisphaerales bacterium]|nr:PEP-CTERM sorting domain-containing protein [Phycisphaerales bacterium]